MDEVIKAEKMKAAKAFAHYAFRKNADRLAYEKTGVAKKGATSNYNEAAVQFLIKKLGAAVVV